MLPNTQYNNPVPIGAMREAIHKYSSAPEWITTNSGFSRWDVVGHGWETISISQLNVRALAQYGKFKPGSAYSPSSPPYSPRCQA